MLEIYTDGSCLKNPNGPGGWAICILEDDTHYIMYDSDKSTTNNRMELTAIIEAVKCVKDECKIYTDSQLCINCATGKWRRKANLDLWSIYDEVSKNKNIVYEWVKGHSGNQYNELVDKYAYNAAKSIS